jgi:hypothetical protein
VSCARRSGVSTPESPFCITLCLRPRPATVCAAAHAAHRQLLRGGRRGSVCGHCCSHRRHGEDAVAGRGWAVFLCASCKGPCRAQALLPRSSAAATVSGCRPGCVLVCCAGVSSAVHSPPCEQAAAEPQGLVGPGLPLHLPLLPLLLLPLPCSFDPHTTFAMLCSIFSLLPCDSCLVAVV